jgi:hypothetical protein
MVKGAAPHFKPTPNHTYAQTNNTTTTHYLHTSVVRTAWALSMRPTAPYASRFSTARSHTSAAPSRLPASARAALIDSCVKRVGVLVG